MNGKYRYIHRFIAEHFIPPTDEDKALGRNQIDHITHKPIGMNINDVRNLRWCTHKENHNFDECRENQRKAMLNQALSEFGKKYIEHYGYGYTENPKQYDREKHYYYRHGRCRWE